MFFLTRTLDCSKVSKFFADNLNIRRKEVMARIIESTDGRRRIIKMSTDDILSVVQDYQRIVPRFSNIENARNYLNDTVIYIPEEV